METENYNFENTASEFIDDVKHDVKKINPNERGNTIEAKGNIKDLYMFLTDIKIKNFQNVLYSILIP